MTAVEVKVSEFEKAIKIYTDDNRILLIWRRIDGRTVGLKINDQNKLVFSVSVDALGEEDLKDLVKINCSKNAGILRLNSSTEQDDGPQVYYSDLPPEAVADGKYTMLEDPTERFFGICMQRKVVHEQITVLRSH